MSVCVSLRRQIRRRFRESVVRRRYVRGDVMTNRVTSLGADGVVDVSAHLYRVKNAPRELLSISLYTVYISTFIYIDFLIDLCPLSVPPVHFFPFFLTEKPVQTKNREIKKREKAILHVQPHICTTAAQQQACIHKSRYL